MSFTVAGSWVWDFWTVYDEPAGRHHLFFLHAPTSLGDPELRHRHARVGHASSTDLHHWHSHPDPLPEPLDGLDDLATWTGCVVGDGEGWWLFTTGLSRRDDGRVQRVGAAQSPDLEIWRRRPWMLTADPRHYETRGEPRGEPSGHAVRDEAWRDPWVVRGDDGLWHMYLTAREAGGGKGCGVVGHATSPDLVDWRVQPPLSTPSGRFEWLEVIQVVQVEQRWVLLFSCLSDQMPGVEAGSGGVWSVPVAGPGSRVEVADAVRLTDERSYVGKVVDHAGSSYLMAFRNQGPDGHFVGGITDPVAVRWREDGRGLELGSHC
jgi:beta-fructofuranosidase